MKHFIHDHPQLQRKLELDDEHVIVDKKVYENLLDGVIQSKIKHTLILHIYSRANPKKDPYKDFLIEKEAINKYQTVTEFYNEVNLLTNRIFQSLNI